MVVALKKEGQAAIFSKKKFGIAFQLSSELLISLAIHASRKDFTIISKSIKLRPPLSSGWHTTFLLILSFLFFHKNENRRL